MVYDNDPGPPNPANPSDWGNGIALFGGKVADGPGEPLDLSTSIAGHPDPF